MLRVIYRPRLVTPGLLVWVRGHVGSYANSSGRTGGWLARNTPLPPMLEEVVRDLCPERKPAEFTEVALQCYEDGRAVTPCHTDVGTEHSFILSLGPYARMLRLHRVPREVWCPDPQQCGNPDLDVIEIECVRGTVVFMDAEFYAGWHHQIPAEPEVAGERLSLVFRTKTKGS